MDNQNQSENNQNNNFDINNYQDLVLSNNNTSLKKNNKKLFTILFSCIAIIILLGGLFIVAKVFSNDDKEYNKEVEPTTTTVVPADDDAKKEAAKKVAVDWIDAYISFNEFCDSLDASLGADELTRQTNKKIEEEIIPRLDRTAIYLKGNTFERKAYNSNKPALTISSYIEFMAGIHPWNERYTIEDVSSVKLYYLDYSSMNVAVVEFKNSNHIPYVVVNTAEMKICAAELKQDTYNRGSYVASIITENDASIKINGVDIKEFSVEWDYERLLNEYDSTSKYNKTEFNVDLGKYNNGNYKFYRIPLVYIPFEYEYTKGEFTKKVTLEEFDGINNFVIKKDIFEGIDPIETTTNLLIMTDEYIK